MTNYSQLTDEEIQEELESGYKDIQEGRCAYVDDAFKNLRKSIETEEEKEQREMMEFVAEFIFEFRERFGDGVRVTVKPINRKRRWVK